eukprot:gene24746-biopygen4437
MVRRSWHDATGQGAGQGGEAAAAASCREQGKHPAVLLRIGICPKQLWTIVSAPPGRERRLRRGPLAKHLLRHRLDHWKKPRGERGSGWGQSGIGCATAAQQCGRTRGPPPKLHVWPSPRSARARETRRRTWSSSSTSTSTPPTAASSTTSSGATATRIMAGSSTRTARPCATPAT